MFNFFMFHQAIAGHLSIRNFLVRLSVRECPPVSSVNKHTLHECLALRNVHRLILGRYKTSGHAADYHVSLNVYLFTPALENLYVNTLA